MADIEISLGFTPESQALLTRLAALQTPARAATATPTTPPIAPAAAGEIYAGVAFTDGKPTHHLFLLEAKPDGKLSWQAAIDWTKGIGAELPTRFESALLYANLRDQFNTDYWHWTSTQYSAGYAWCQDFGHGSQNSDGKSYEALARAVRRLPL